MPSVLSHLVAMSFRKNVSESKSEVHHHLQIKDCITDVCLQLCYNELLILNCKSECTAFLCDNV